MSRVFLDAVAGQPMSAAAQTTLEASIDTGWADPRALNHEGKSAAKLYEAARATAAIVTQCDPDSVLFLPSPIAPLMLVRAAAETLDCSRFFASPIERDVVLTATRDLAGARGVPFIELAADRFGRVSPPANPTGPCVFVVQAANLEIGTIQETQTWRDLARLDDRAWVCDASGIAGFGELPDCKYVFADARTFAGPPGVTVAIVRARVPGWLRDAEVDATAAATTAAALYDVHTRQGELVPAFEACSQYLRTTIPEQLGDVDVLGHPTQRLAAVTAFSFLYVDGERLANDLDRAGFAIGSGSACAARAGLPSHVLTAIGALTHGNVRVSLPLSVRVDDCARFTDALVDAVTRARAED